MQKVDGIISRRIRDNEIDADIKYKGNTEDDEPLPSVDAMKRAEGHRLGKAPGRRA